ncbi:FxLYD domain-containing protein [Halopelagius fulvigenes]|uniref:FxLYD domain-containing protein n=1 Tax=Halopelagius fulvigenes TaxID=1198324 RepID=A0ABD5TVG6_9EURY
MLGLNLASNTSTEYCQTVDAGETWRAFVPLLGNDAGNADSVKIEAEFSQDAPSVPDGVTVEESSLSGGDTDEVISTGVAKNGTDSELRYLESISKLYAGDVLIGTSYTNLTGLPAGETWEFENTLLRRHEPEITKQEIVLST